jgi:hypothetical protein
MHILGISAQLRYTVNARRLTDRENDVSEVPPHY